MTTPATRKSLWIPWTFVAFFAVVVAVNGVMIYYATTTFSGVDRRDAYRRGIAYNEVLQAAQEQAALGWTGRLAHTGLAEGVGRLTLTVTDGTGQPIDRAVVRVLMKRPTNAGLDFTLALDADGIGGYVTEVAWPAPGVWDAVVRIEARGHRFQVDERLVVR